MNTHCSLDTPMGSCRQLPAMLSLRRTPWHLLLGILAAVAVALQGGIMGAHAQSPTLTGHTPVTNAVAAPLDSNVVLTYSAAIDAATVTSRTVAVHGMMHGLVTGTHSVNGSVVTVDAQRDFFPGELVYAVATTQTTAITGTHALSSIQWQFTAGAVANRCVTGFVDSGAVDDALAGTWRGSTVWGDYDGDGDLDVLITGEDVVDTSLQAKIYRNDGGVLVDSGTADDALVGVNWSSVAWGDYDNDGDLDILLTGHPGSYGLSKVYRNDGGIFVDSGAADDALVGVYRSSVAWGDYDNDGDLDILLTGSLVSKVYRNDSGIFVDSGSADDALVGVGSGSVAWGDYDDDGDLDILLAGWDGSSRVAKIYRNDGGVFVDSASADDALVGVADSGGDVAWGDYDNDGDLDILLAGDTGSSIVTRVYRNDGGVFAESGTADDALVGVSWGSVAWGDYDNDGDLDILLTGNKTYAYDFTSKVYRNDGGVFVDSGTADDALVRTWIGGGAWGDYDNDGDLDILITGGTANSLIARIYRNDDCADVGIAKAVTPSLVAPGATITYTLSFSNTGPGAANDVMIRDRVPAGVALTGIFSSGVPIAQTVGAPYFAWTVRNLAVGAEGVITLTGVVAPLLTHIAAITNTATITSINDISATNNSASASFALNSNARTFLPFIQSGPVQASMREPMSDGVDIPPLTYTATRSTAAITSLSTGFLRK